MNKHYYKNTIIASLMIWALAVMPLAAAAQTRVNMPKNKYKVEDDVKAGREYSQQIEQQFPILNDAQTTRYIQDVGARLVASIPQQFRQSAFQYNFKVVNASDINAFALPGGPMYVNRGMIEAAKNEGEMAGVMAHEISHVALRHSTAQATNQGSLKNQLGMLGMILGGAILGGQAGAQLGAMGAQVWMTKYSRDYEKNADILGAQIMANAGYDPRDLANMFQTIAGEGGSRMPQWLSTHPDPGNRFRDINNEANRLNVSQNPIKMTAGFERAQARLRSMSPAPTMSQIQQQAEAGQQNPTAGGRYTNNVPAPATRYQTYNGGVRINYPSNWREFSTQSSVTFAPEGAYGDQGITHGMLIGTHRSNSNNINQASQELINSMLQGNNYLQQRDNLRNVNVAGRQGRVTTLAGRSPITRQNEVVTFYIAPLADGSLIYFASVAPEQMTTSYNRTFRTMLNSVRINDR